MRDYNNSIYTAVRKVYTEYPWEAWKFDQFPKLPKDYFEDPTNHRPYLEKYAAKVMFKAEFNAPFY